MFTSTRYLGLACTVREYKSIGACSLQSSTWDFLHRQGIFGCTGMLTSVRYIRLDCTLREYVCTGMFSSALDMEFAFILIRNTPIRECSLQPSPWDLPAPLRIFLFSSRSLQLSTVRESFFFLSFFFTFS